MRVWPGRSYPLGATWDGAGVNFALFSEHATKVELCLFDAVEGDQGITERPDAGAYRSRLALLPARRAARPAVRLPRPRAVRAGQRPPLQPEQGPARPLRQGDRPRPALGRFAVRLQDRRPQGRPLARRPRQRRLRAARRRRRSGLHLGRRPAAADTVAQDAHLRAARQGLHQADARRPGEVPGHLRRPRLGSRHRTSEIARRHRRRADAGASPRGRPPPRREGPDQLLGLQHAGLFRPRPALRLRRHGPRIGAAVQDDGPRPARGRHRGHPRRGLQPHRRGQPARADAVDARHRQRLLLPPVAEGQALLHGLHRLRQHAQHGPPARAAAHHGQPALLGAGNARGRLPLRPGLAPWPASCSPSTSWAPSSTSSTRTRCCRRSS